MERAMVDLASGDEAKLERTHEIISWFSTRKEMRHAAKAVFRNLTVEEDERLTPNGMTTPSGAPVNSLAALVWAMEGTEGGSCPEGAVVGVSISPSLPRRPKGARGGCRHGDAHSGDALGAIRNRGKRGGGRDG